MPDAAKARRWPIGFLGMIAAIAAIESGREGRDRGHQAWLIDSWIEARRAASDQAPGRPILCFGDSQVQQGVLPRVVAAHAGRDGYNLAVPGGQPVSSYHLLKRSMESGARPEAVVLGHYPGLLVSGPEINRAAWPELLDPIELIDLAWNARSLDLFARDLIRRMVPTINRRDRLRERIAAALEGRATIDSIDEQAITYRNNARRNAGALALPPDPRFRDGAAPPPPPPGGAAGGGPPDPRAAARVWRPHPVQDSYLRRFLDLAQERGIEVFWTMPILSPAVRDDPARARVEAGYESYVRSLLDDYPCLVVLDGRRAGMDATVFRDTVHLDCVGAAELSRAMGIVLGERLGSGPRSDATRWVPLPVNRPRVPDVASAEHGREGRAGEQADVAHR
jgi:hypothetical protein